MKRYRWVWPLLIILLPSFACQAAMRLVASAAPAPTATRAPISAVRPQPTQPVTCEQEVRSVLLAANTQSVVPAHFPSVDTGQEADVHLVTYDVSGDKLSAPIILPAPGNLMPYQRDFERQRLTWALFAAMIPEQQRGMLSRFEVVTDGPGGVLSAVEPTVSDPRRWVLEADIADMSDTKNLAFTLLHEFGHLLTLGPEQVPPGAQDSNGPDNTRARERSTDACDSYFPGEGCSLQSSYINGYFQGFWKEIYEQWTAIDRLKNDDRHEEELQVFYRTHEDDFVDSYAVTSPVEDIAETWAFFVLSPRPTGSRVVDRKLEFFYGYPELVKLREQILSGLCAANP